MPKVSIIVTVHNAGKYFETLLDSVCNQTFKDIEIILVDDGSTDGSRDIIKKYSEQDSRIISIFREKNLNEHFGKKASFDLGLKYASGNYIMIVDHDDELPLNSIELLYNATENETIDVIQGRNYSINEDYEPPQITYKTPNLWPEKTIINLSEQSYSMDELVNHFLNGPSALWDCLIKKSLLETLELGDYLINDYTFIWKLKLFAKTFCYLPEYVYIDHLHRKDSAFGSYLNEQPYFDIFTGVTDIEKDLKKFGANSLLWEFHALATFNLLKRYYFSQTNIELQELFYKEFKKEMKRNLNISNILKSDKELLSFYQELIK